VDPDELARAVEDAVGAQFDSLDYRTRLLVRDGLDALRSYWGAVRFDTWFARSPQRDALNRLRRDDTIASTPPDDGFPTLAGRLVKPTDRNTVMQLLRELSAHVTQPTRLVIGGSIAMLLAGHLARHTDDIDVVDELPANLRLQPELLENLAWRYGLRLAHFQSHFLPAGWEARVHSIDTLARLQVFAVDAYDVFVGKLFSVREKDRDDLRALAPRLDRAIVQDRVARTTSDLRSEPRLLDAAKRNWFILFGDELPA
jgi:hypothetical protein